MISIDYNAEVELYNNDEPDKPIKKLFPRHHDAYQFWIHPIEHTPNINNEKMEPRLRNMVEKVTYGVFATVYLYECGQFEDRLIVRFETEPEAVKVYDEVMDAIARGDKLYSFRRSHNDGKQGHNSED